MADMNGMAAKVARAYFDAMATKNIEGVIALTASNVTCDSPVGQLSGIEAYRGFQEGFGRMLEKLTLRAVFGDDAQAVLVYVADTLPVKGAYVAEYLTVKAGKITSNRVIYDGVPFAPYMASQPKH
jgi:hypothetical protein